MVFLPLDLHIYDAPFRSQKHLLQVSSTRVSLYLMIYFPHGLDVVEQYSVKFKRVILFFHVSVCLHTFVCPSH